MPGRSYSAEQKTDAGRKLDTLGVDCIQAGFPITGEKDRTVIRTLAAECDAQIVALSRAVTRDVDAAIESNADVVEVFVPIAEHQLEYTLEKPYGDVLEQARDAIDRSIERGATATLTLVDAFRTDPDRLREAAKTFSDLEFITLADTVGVRTPASVRELLTTLEDDVELSRLGVHFHDDLGVATANVLTAYEAGIGKADVSVASLGERAGNPALEEVVACGVVEYDDSFGVDNDRLVPCCEEILSLLNESDVSGPRKAILGDEVVEHESGIHTAAMLQEPGVFEPYDPDIFGGERSLKFGAGTGQSGASLLLSRTGIEPTTETIDAFLSLLAENGPMDADEATELARATFEAEQ